MLNEIINHLILKILCAACGSFSSVNNGLCKNCENQAQHSMSPSATQHPVNSAILVRYLFSWKRDESELKNRIMTMLKGNKSSDAWKYWAVEFIREHKQYKKIAGKTLFIPIVGKTLDHSFYFAKSLSEVTGFPMEKMFRQDKNKSSKGLRKRDRQRNKSKFYMGATNVKMSDFERIIVVDDILTTGETSANLLKEIKHENIEVWVLAYRELSCE